MRRLAWPLIGVLAGCFSGDGTVGSICFEADDCGKGQGCESQICGRCRNGTRQVGEVCVGEGEELGGPALDRMVVADLEGNGTDDLVARGVTGELWLFRSQGGKLEPEATGEAGVLAIAAGALDGEPGLDVIVTGDGGEIRLVGGSVVDTVGGFLDSAVVADLDGDERGDLVLGDADQQLVHVILGNGDGTFRADTPVAACAGVYVAGVADPNADGRPDAVVVCRDESRLLVFEGNGQGTLSQGDAVSFERPVTGATLVDLDGDLDLDVVVHTGIEQVELLWAREGELDGPTPLELEGVPTAAVAVDLTNDGRPDLVVADPAGLNIFPSRFGTFPDLARRELTGTVGPVVTLDATGLLTHDLVVASATATVYREAP